MEIEKELTNKSLSDVFHIKLDFANKYGVTSFIFDYNGHIYISEWKKYVWSEPRKIIKL